MIRPYSRSLTLTGFAGSMNIFELLGSTFQARTDTLTILFGSSRFSLMADEATLAVISLASEAGSTRMFALSEASTWPLVASSSSHDLAAMVGGGTICAWTEGNNSWTLTMARAANSFFMGRERWVQVNAARRGGGGRGRRGG